MRVGPLRGAGPAGGVFSKVFASVVLLFFLGIGSFFTYLVARSVVSGARTYSWVQTPCEIVSSRVARNPASADPDEKFVFDVEYRYERSGRSYSSRQFRPGYNGSNQVAEAARLAARYPAGASATCRVDPGNPRNAALERPSLWAAAVILFPLVFVLVGAGGLAALWWPKRERTTEESGVEQAISRKAVSAGKAQGCLAAFFGLFFAVGLATFYFFFAKPAMRVAAARSWREMPCVVLSSRVRTHEGDDGGTYSVDILYEYEFGGRTYRSNRFQFLGGSSGGSAAKEAVVARHPPGRRTVCWVDPADPQEAVLVRSLTKDYWAGLVPLLFMLAGGGGLLWVGSKARTLRAASAAEAGWGRDASRPAGGGWRFADRETGSGPATLEPSAGPVRKFLIILLITLFWNGIVSVFVWQAAKGWRSGNPDGCLTVFLVPFVVVGLLMTWSLFHQYLALFNPRPRVTLSTRSIPLGGSAAVDWSFSGAASRIAKLRILVEGREECRYRRGTDVHTDRETFATIEIVEVSGPAAGAPGHAALRIPADTMHSWTASNNKVVWTLKLRGEIPSWPDIAEEFDLSIRPAAESGAQGA
ncbi:MAG: DUF3592 domain-containing protein [Thermoanaerobaculia bacterium]